jgi:hypothetical protein
MAKKAAGEMATSQASGHLFGNMRLQCRDVTAVTVTSSSVTTFLRVPGGLTGFCAEQYNAVPAVISLAPRSPVGL